MTIHLLLPNYENYSGHENSFISSYIKLAKLVKKKINFYVSENNQIHLNNKIKIFRSIKQKKFINKIKNIFYNSKKLNLIYNENQYGKDIYIVDGHSLTFVVSIILSCLFLKKKKSKFLIFCREPYFLNIIKKKIYSLMFMLLNKKFINFFILTDTKQLQIEINKIHLNSVYLLPIPHIINHIKKKKINNTRLVILLPGQYRKDKGEENILKFIKKNLGKKFTLKINKNFNISSSKNIEKISNNLSKEEYIKTLDMSDIIFLPYDSQRYFYSSSGIFIEAISMNKICLVSDNTWMSEIFKLNHLEKLIIKDWKSLSMQSIHVILADQDIRKKYEKLKKNILLKNNPTTFINEIKKLI